MHWCIVKTVSFGDKKTIDGMEGEVLFVLKQKKNKGLLVGGDISNIRKLHCVLNRDFKYAEVRI